MPERPTPRLRITHRWHAGRSAEHRRMVRIDSVATRSGDDGTTGLGDGRRVAKDHPLIEAIGAVDAALCALGVVRALTLPDWLAARLRVAQNDGFDLGADLAVPPGARHREHVAVIDDARTTRLDAWLAEDNAGLAPLRSFVLPGGSEAGARLHVARASVREAERRVITAARHGDPAVNPACQRYLNRLADLCFVWARRVNEGRDELWQPGSVSPAATPHAPS